MGVRTDAGEVYMCGSNYKYKLALEKVKDNSHGMDLYHVLTHVPYFTQQKIFVSHLECGGIHSCAMDDKQNIYTWGCGSDGRLGHPEGEGYVYLYKEKLPKVVEKLRGIAKQFSSAYYTILAIAQ